MVFTATIQITITPGYLNNSGILNNYGQLSNGSFGDHTGYLDNLGTLTNFGGGTLNNSGGIFGNGTYEQTAGQTTINGMQNDPRLRWKIFLWGLNLSNLKKSSSNMKISQTAL